jgi:hypothetical protein
LKTGSDYSPKNTEHATACQSERALMIRPHASIVYEGPPAQKIHHGVDLIYGDSCTLYDAQRSVIQSRR